MDSPLLRGHATSLQRVRRDRTRSQRDNVALLGGVRMEARTALFRETGEARLKEQLLIETMFCVYYLSKGSAVLAAHAPRLHLIFCLYIYIRSARVAAQSLLSVAMTKLDRQPAGPRARRSRQPHGRRPVRADEPERGSQGRRRG